MKGLNLDFKAIATQTAGNVAGLAVCGGLNKIPFVASKSPMIKGLITIGVARLALPFLTAKLGLAGKKGGDFAKGAEEAAATYGIAQVAGTIPGLSNFIPKISGYEDSPYVRGLGMVTEEESTVNGEEEAVNGGDDTVYMDNQ